MNTQVAKKEIGRSFDLRGAHQGTNVSEQWLELKSSAEKWVAAASAALRLHGGGSAMIRAEFSATAQSYEKITVLI